MSKVRNALQAASNTAAGTISAPVDGLAWLLRKAGVPVPANPLMGSDWMAQRGLTAPVQQGAGQVVGETLGMLAPTAVAMQAPRIANALLQGGRNLAAPRTLNPQTGAVVWHGSPHKFDAFDSSKIGTGEGAQAYGHGLYLADAPDVAGTYKTGGGAFQTAMQSDNVMIDGKTWAKTLPRSSVESQAASVFANDIYGATIPEKVAKLRKANMAPVADWLEKNAGRLSLDQGNLYKVDLPDEKIARMLDWDAPLSQQAPEVQKAMANFDPDMYHPSGNDYDANELGQQMYRRLHEMMIRKGAAKPAAVKEQEAVAALRKAGIPGIRYLDGGSRGAGQGTRNYVVFPGEEGALKILERNGNALQR